MIVREALPPQSTAYQLLDFYPCLQLTTRVQLSNGHLQRKYPETACWLLLVDVRVVPLCYVHRLITSFGISPYALVGLAYTTNGGQHADSLMQATNIYVQLNSQHDLERLADRWYPDEATNCINNGTIVTAQRSPRITKIQYGHVQQRLVCMTPMPTLLEYKAEVDGPLYTHHEVNFDRLPPPARYAVYSAPTMAKATSSTIAPAVGPATRMTSPKRTPTDTSMRRGKLQRTDDGMDDDMEVDDPPTDLATLTLHNDDRPGHGVALLARMRASVEQVIEYDETNGIIALRSLMEYYLNERMERRKATAQQISTVQGEDNKLTGTGHALDLHGVSALARSQRMHAAEHALLQGCEPVVQFEYVHADWLATPGDGLCGYHAIAAALKAAGLRVTANLTAFLQSVPLRNASQDLMEKLCGVIQHLSFHPGTPVPRECWCSVADILEIVQLCSVSATVWISEKYLHCDAVERQPPNRLYAYRSWNSAGPRVHIALHEHHFYHMRHAPTSNVRSVIMPTQDIDLSVGCGVIPQHFSHNPLMQRLENLSLQTGGTRAAPSNDTKTQTLGEGADEPKIRVPEHTIATAEAQHWVNDGVLFRLLLHETPTRAITVVRNTTQLWKATLHKVLSALPTGGMNTAIKRTLAQITNQSVPSDSLLHPASCGLSLHDLLHVANHLSLPVVFWRAGDNSAEHTFHRCVLHSCSATATSVPWRSVQHVAHVRGQLVRIEECVEATPALLDRLRQRVVDYESMYPAARFHADSALSHHNLAAQHHFLQRAPNVAKHIVLPALPSFIDVNATRHMRSSQRVRAAVYQFENIPPLLRMLPLPVAFLRHHDLHECDPEVILHYWHHRDYNKYVHVVYVDQVAGRGAAGLYASTFIPKNTLIAPYVGVTKSRRHSTAYTAEMVNGRIDAAEVVHDYGYHLFSACEQSNAPYNVARFANSLRHDQLTNMSYNSHLGDSPVCAGFDTIWLIAATDIQPGTEVLCNYGTRFQLPSAAPAPATPPTQSSQHSLILTYTSTGTLVDSSVNSRPCSKKRARRTSRWQSPPSQQTQGSSVCSVSTVDLTTDFVDDDTCEHVVHLHPFGPAYSSDEAGDGPEVEKRCRQLLQYLVEEPQDHDDKLETPTLSMSEAPIYMDLAPAAVKLLHAAVDAAGTSLGPADLQQLLASEQAATLMQPLPEQCFHNTQGRGYCGYIIILQAALAHHFDMCAYPDLTVVHWRRILSTVLALIPESEHTVSVEMAPERQQLTAKLSYICQRLSANADDNGTLPQHYWLSSDEVLCALTLLQIPCTLWLQHHLITMPAAAGRQLTLVQTSPNCRIACTHFTTAEMVQFLTRTQIGYARSHFFLLRQGLQQDMAECVVQDFYMRCSHLTLEQLEWLALQECNGMQLPSNSPLNSTSGTHAPTAALDTSMQRSVAEQQQYDAAQSSSRLDDELNFQQPSVGMAVATAPMSQLAHSSHGTESRVFSSPEVNRVVTELSVRPSGRRKHKRQARQDALHEKIVCEEEPLFPSTPQDMSSTQQLNVAYWNTNGHLVGGSALTICRLIEHLCIDVCVLIDTRLSQRAGEYHAAAIKHFLPGSSVVLHSTTRHYSKQAGGRRMQTMGGAMYVIAPRCNAALRTSHPDASSLGVTGYIQLSVAGRGYRICHAYIPPAPSSADGAATLNRRLRAFLDTAGQGITPQDYIFSRLTAWITAARTQDTSIVVGGDFNHDPAKTTGVVLQQWAQALALSNVMDILHPSTSIPTHMVGGTPRTRLDHIYVDMHTAHALRTANVLQEPLTAVLSDHCPIYTGIQCPGIVPAARSPAQPPPPSRLELPHHNPLIVEHFQSQLDDWTRMHASDTQDMTAAHAAALLGALMGATTDAVEQVTAPRRRLQLLIGHRSRFKDGFTPLYCALKRALLLLLRLQRDLYRARQLSSSVRADDVPRDLFTSGVILWRQQNPPSSFPAVQRSTLVKAADILALRAAVFLCHDDLAERIADMRRMMHGRRRTEWRRQQSERTALLEDMRAAQRFKQLFRRIGIKDRVTVSLDTLAVGNDLLMDPQQIHSALTAHFAEWYRSPVETHPYAQQLDDPLWIAALLDGTARSRADLPQSFRQQQFIDACRSRVTDEQRQSIQHSIDAPLTMEEYTAEVHLLCHGKAPGPSGVTATMIKAWPADTHLVVFQCLHTIWQTRSVPQWWLHSYLHPIPKKGASHLDNLRPLGLYEITRKLLAAIIIKRAYRAWEQQRLLHPNQHAYRRGVGTGTAILRLLNLVEDATESSQQLFVTAWDIKRAFDSIPHSFIRLALLRLGVSDATASWFHYMLQHNVVTVQSPHVQRTVHAPFHSDPGTFCDAPHASQAASSFHQERGIGQGDTPSAILWVALYDILLCMLDTSPSSDSGHFLARGPLGSVYAASSISYADDLCTPAGSLQLSQYHADIVSTFCAATTLTIAAPKVLAFALNSRGSSTLTLYDWTWCPRYVSFCEAGVAMTYLGLDSSHHLGDTSAHTAAIATIRAGTTALRSRAASPHCKLAVVRMQLYPKVLYPAAKACWSLQEFRQLDSTLAVLLKHTSRYMQSIATDMLYFPETHGGTGQHKLSDLAQARKWSELRRALITSGEVALAAHGLLERGMRQMECILPSSMQRQFPQTHLQFLKCFAGSLIEWGIDAGCSLTSTPAAPFRQADAPITPYLDPTEHAHLLRTLQQRDITAQGELLTRRHDGTVRWSNDPFATTLRAALGRNAVALPTSDALTFAAGQIFHVQPLDQYVEFYGILANAPCTTLIIRKWTPAAASGIIRYQLETATPWQHIAHASLAEQHWTRLITTPARSPKDWSYRRILQRTCCEVPLIPRSYSPSHHDSIDAFLQDILLAQQATGCTYNLFTDGSFCMPDLPPSAILDSEATRRRSGRATAAIVAIGDPLRWRQQPLIVLRILAGALTLPGASAYTAELLALVLAVRVVRSMRTSSGLPTIYSDCKAAVDTVRGAITSQTSKQDTHCTHILTDSVRSTGFTRISWVRSHPERRSDTSTWSYTDWGIWLADKAASGQHLSPLHPEAITLSHSIVYSEAVTALLPPATWHWSQLGTGQPLLCSLLPQLQQRRVHAYLERRDRVWRDASLPARWEGTSLSHAAQGWRLLGRTQRVNGTTILRHCLDKCWHGRNRAKGLRTSQAISIASACEYCNMPDDQMHSILHCKHPELAELRCTAHHQLASAADSLLQDAAVSGEPILLSLVHFMLQRSSDYQYKNVDRIWLGTWNADVLSDCLQHNRGPHFMPPATLPYTLIQRFTRVAARLQCILNRFFLTLHKTAKQRLLPRTPPASTLTNTPASQLPQATSKQRRLTTIWQVPPPYIPDRPALQRPSRTLQRHITAFFTPASAAQQRSDELPPASHSSLEPTPLARQQQRRSRASASPAAGSIEARRTFDRRVYSPHVATNPANSTPDHDPDKM